MNINQAFKILSNISDPHIARIITDAIPNMSRFRIWRISRQLRANVPVAKIIHNKWFYGLKFYTNKWTLDPRPDTETLVDAVINDYKRAKHISYEHLMERYQSGRTGAVLKTVDLHGSGGSNPSRSAKMEAW